MNNNQLNPVIDGIPQDIDRFLNDEVRNTIEEQIKNYPAFYNNPYVVDDEQEYLDILIRRRKFDRLNQQNPSKEFNSRQEFREYVVDVWVNQIGYSPESFPGFIKACKKLNIPVPRNLFKL